MTKYRMWSVCAVVAVAVTLSAAVVAGANQMLRARPTAVGVVDVERVFNSLQEKRAIEAELRPRMEELVREEARRKQELDDLEEELDILSPSHAEYRAKDEERARKTYELRAWAEWQRAAVISENHLQTLQLFRKIETAVAQVAQQSGFDIVLYKEGDITREWVAQKRGDPAPLIRSHKVLFAVEELDLTDQVVQAMDNQWRNNVGADETPAPAPAPQPQPQ